MEEVTAHPPMYAAAPTDAAVPTLLEPDRAPTSPPTPPAPDAYVDGSGIVAIHVGSGYGLDAAGVHVLVDGARGQWGLCGTDDGGGGGGPVDDVASVRPASPSPPAMSSSTSAPNSAPAGPSSMLARFTARARAKVLAWLDTPDESGEDGAELMLLYAADPQWAPRSATPARVAVILASMLNAMATHETLTGVFSQFWCTYTTSDGVTHTSTITEEGRGLLIAATVLAFVVALFIVVRMFGLIRQIAVVVSASAAVVAAALLVLTSALWRSHIEDTLPADATVIAAGTSLIAVIVAAVESLLCALLLLFDRLILGSVDRLTASDRRFVIAVLLLSVMISIGAIIYRAVEGWSYDRAISFVLSTITTIGYGNIVPATVGGQVFTYFYGVAGIVAVGFTLDASRDKIVEVIVAASKRIERRRRFFRRRGALVNVFSVTERATSSLRFNWIVAFLLVLLLWLGGAGVFVALEHNWTYSASVWFTFSTLTTIGYGDYYPTTASAETFLNYFVFCGLAVIAYMLSLVGETTRQSLESKFAKAEASELHGSHIGKDGAPGSAAGGARGFNSDPRGSMTFNSVEHLRTSMQRDLVALRDVALAVETKAAGTSAGADAHSLVEVIDNALLQLGVRS